MSPKCPGRPKIGPKMEIPLPPELRAELEAEAARRGAKLAETARTAMQLGLAAMRAEPIPSKEQR